LYCSVVCWNSETEKRLGYGLIIAIFEFRPSKFENRESKIANILHAYNIPCIHSTPSPGDADLILENVWSMMTMKKLSDRFIL